MTPPDHLFAQLHFESSDKKSWFYKVSNPSPVGDVGSAGSSSSVGSALPQYIILGLLAATRIIIP
ncbi:MAG: hypothetical protein WBE34_19195 [Candidatus Nitrosopolaris sp.]